MTNDCALDLRCSKPMTGHVEHVIDPSHNPKITILVATGAITGEVVPFVLAPVLFSIALFVPVDRAQHGGPWPADNQFASDVWANFFSPLIHYRRIYSEEGESRAAGFG